MPRQRTHSLASHRVALVRHRATSNLILLEGLLDLLEVGEQADIGRNLVRGGGERGEWTENVDIDLARVSLTGNGVRLSEARQLGDEFVELFHLSTRLCLVVITLGH